MRYNFTKLFLLPTLLLAATVTAQAAAMTVITGDHELGYLNLSTGAFSFGGFTSPTGVGLGSSTAGLPYLISNETSLYNVNATNGNTTSIGSTGVLLSIGGSFAGDLIYGLDFNNNLFSLSSTTGLATFIGATGLPTIQLTDVFSNALAGDGSTLYYVFEIAGASNVSSGLYRLDTNTGAATLIGLTGATNITGAGVTEGSLYGFTDLGRQILTLNTLTGASSLLTTYTGTTGPIWGAISTPEPSTFALLAFGLALVGLALLRKVED